MSVPPLSRPLPPETVAMPGDGDPHILVLLCARRCLSAGGAFRDLPLGFRGAGARCADERGGLDLPW